jgi:hypothetical protein
MEMDEREQLGEDLKKALRDIQKSLNFTDKQFKRALSSSAAWGKETVKKCRGYGTVSGLIRYLNFLAERLSQVSIQDIEKSLTITPTADIEKTIHLRFGETFQEFDEYGTFHVIDWLEMGANIEEWLTYALSSERMNYYTKTKEYFAKSKAYRKLINSIQSKYSLFGVTEDSKIIKKLEQTKEIIKSQNALMLQMVEDKKKDLLNYLSKFFEKGVDYEDHRSLILLGDKLEQVWTSLYNGNISEYKQFSEAQELNKKEIEATINDGIKKIESIPAFEDIENIDEQVRALLDTNINSKKYFEAFFQMLTLSANDPNFFKENFHKDVNPKRNHIPSDVKREVWRRDMGRCSKCGSRKNIEYDHIIPVSKGGSNTSRNIELLCQDCNRKKRIGLRDNHVR